MIKFIFVTILIIFFIRLVAPVLLRWLLAAFIKKKVRNGSFFYTNMNQQRQQQQYQEDGDGRKAEGKVKIDYIPEQPNRKGFDGGEYVEYEEVK
ncbi:DUF4834 family protein [Pontibacter akesuensis]|uniref:DUF4834 domain-containing protein n=1 Tax=Pontibacter akesuensis TaxID=388950 RepID=A0A1I7IH91_9BACT|nr:DUF4834 family protein [Pontibacter akesuensis]GHA67145.1 hypothetical protein GCM10007389_20350 [Pontibacter akesuensis]SFU72246.1 protein of unknown function [Pontibacter akesuensis]